MADLDVNAMATLVRDAIRFAVWAGGEGFYPADPSEASAPEEFLFDYATASGDEDYDGYADAAYVALISAHEAGRTAGPEWRPISEAPKDGTWFLATDGREIFKTQGAYGHVWIPNPNGNGGHIPDPQRKSFSWLSSEFDSLTPWSPTHFMPLPPPPKEPMAIEEIARATLATSKQSGGGDE